MDYPAQPQLKERIVRANLTEVPAERFRPILGWRPCLLNKMEHTFGPDPAWPPRGRYGTWWISSIACSPSPTRSGTPSATTGGRAGAYLKRTHLGKRAIW